MNAPVPSRAPRAHLQAPHVVRRHIHRQCEAEQHGARGRGHGHRQRAARWPGGCGCRGCACCGGGRGGGGHVRRSRRDCRRGGDERQWQLRVQRGRAQCYPARAARKQTPNVSTIRCLAIRYDTIRYVFTCLHVLYGTSPHRAAAARCRAPGGSSRTRQAGEGVTLHPPSATCQYYL
jgi:hypothetical protein